MGRVAGSDRMYSYIYGNTYLVYACYVCELVSMWRSTRSTMWARASVLIYNITV